MKEVFILGAGPQARIIPDLIDAVEDIELSGFVDVSEERDFLTGDATRFPVFEWLAFQQKISQISEQSHIIIATDKMEKRIELINQVRNLPVILINIIHPSAIISKSANIGEGCLIAPGVIIGPGAEVGSHVILNSAATIDHDTVIQDNVMIGPGVHIPGHVLIRSHTFIGVGSSCVNSITIGSNCLIGAGSVVTRDIPDNVIAAGVPAKVIREKDC